MLHYINNWSCIMKPILFFHRNIKCGFSINKVSQTFIRKIDDYQEFYAPFNRADVISLLRNLLFVFRHRNKHAINHITGDIHYCIMALLGCKSVLTIHDTNMYDFCRNPLKRWVFRWFWFKLPIRFAGKVVCISTETKRRVLQFSKRKDIEVIYNAVDDSFLRQKPQPVPYHKKPHILLIGTNVNKNVVRTIEALSGIECQLIIIGHLNDEISNALKKHQMDYIIKTKLRDAEIIEEYRACDIVSFCSIYEGFGMPIIEGNAMGRPVITSCIEPLIEIAGDAALLVSPYDVEDMRRGFLNLINDSTLRLRLVENGLKNIMRFQSQEIAKQYMNLYKSL